MLPYFRTLIVSDSVRSANIFDSTVTNFGQMRGDHAYVAALNKMVVGIIWSHLLIDANTLFLDSPTLALSVLPEHQRQGIGGELTLAFLEHLSDVNYPAVTCLVPNDNGLLLFFSNLGFGVTQKDETHFVMSKALAKESIKN